MRRLGELPFIVAVREALPWSFIGLAAAFAVILAARAAQRHLARPALGSPSRSGSASSLRRYGDGVGRRSAAAPRQGGALPRVAAAAWERRRLRARSAAPVRPRSDCLSAAAWCRGTLYRDIGLRRDGRVDRLGATRVARTAGPSMPARRWGSARLPHCWRCTSRCPQRSPPRCIRSRDWATPISR